jgi:hypothetical protein
MQPATSGRHGFAVRVIPGGELFDGQPEPGLILWEGGAREPEKPQDAPGKRR